MYIFVSESGNFGKNPPFYEVNKWAQKWPRVKEIQKKEGTECTTT